MLNILQYFPLNFNHLQKSNTKSLFDLQNFILFDRIIRVEILIKGGRVIDVGQKIDDTLDILVKNGKIAKIGKNIRAAGAKVIDAGGKIVCPGFIDIHSHLREPGYEYKETIKTASLSALRGGFTTIFSMPNTRPCCDNASVVEFIINKAKKESPIAVYPVGALTKNLEGKNLSDIGLMKEAGIVALSDDGKCVQNANIMRCALEYAKMFNLPVICHCEDENLSSRGVVNEGYYATIYGLRGQPDVAESIIVERDIQLAEITGCPVHITHISCERSVEEIRRAKKKGIKVTCDVTPHHLTLTDASLHSYDTNLKVNPPLRTEEDRQFLIKGLIDGTIDCIATDHAPHSSEEKEVEFDLAPFGISGLETAVGLVFSELLKRPKIKITDIISLFTSSPAQIFKIKKGEISLGADADITILDINKKWKVEVAKFASKGKNSPFEGWEITTKVDGVMAGGKYYQFS